MSLSLLARNACKMNGWSICRTVRLTPLKSLTTRAIAPRTDAVKSLVPIVRNISLSASRMSAAGGSHTTLWTVEKAFSVALLGALPAAFLWPSQALDAALAIAVVLHTHWGIEAVLVDYLRPRVVGNLAAKGSIAILYLLSIATLGGLFYFIYNDVGVAKSIKQLWSIKGAGQKEN